MLEHWLSPVDFGEHDILSSISKDQFGRNIAIHFGKLDDLKKVNIAIVGISEDEANVVRQSLYSLSYPFHQLRIADLGNIRNDDPSFIISIITELLESNILPILIGRSPRNIFSQFRAYQALKKAANVVCIDERIQYSYQIQEKQYLNDILLAQESNLHNLGIIGYQGHYTTDALLNMMMENNFDTVRLGKLKRNIEFAEPIIRDADMIAFHLNALKQSEINAIAQPTPSGLFSEEACKLCHYAGMSDKLTSFGIFGLLAEKDLDQQASQIVSQMIWYFIDGYDHRKGDFPASMDGLTEYIVELNHIDQPVTFWKSKRSGRWWMQVPVKDQKAHQRHRLLPCTYEDYANACNHKLPDRLLNAYRKFN